MTNTIDYDRPVINLIDELYATGHVTLSPNYTKTSVTIHHNAGINTAQQVLDDWKTQQSSAHFDVDAQGTVAQYVETDKYAWAVGSTEGNQSSISIEQCNSTLAPGWDVSETTWKASARLAAWLFVNVIHAAPTSSNLHPHHFWSATECPGPYMDSIWSEYVAEVQAQYEAFTNGTIVAPPVSVSTGLLEDGKLGYNTIKRWQQIMGTGQDGVISTPVSDLVTAVQKELNLKINAGLTVDGNGVFQDGKFYHTAKALQQYLGTPQDGIISTPVSQAVKALQIRLNTGSF